MRIKSKTWEHASLYIPFTKIDTITHGNYMADDST